MIFRAALTVACVTVVVKAGGVVKDLVLAKSFGRNDSLDAFLFAFMLPSFAMTVIMGALSAATVPVLVRTRQKEGLAAGRQLLATVTLLIGALLTGVAVLMALFQPWYLPLLARGFSPEKLSLTREYLYVLLPWMVACGLSTFLAAILNAVEKFALPALIPLLTPLAIIVFITTGIKHGGLDLAMGTVAGSLLEASVMFYLARRHGILGAMSWHGLDENARTILRQAVPLMSGGFLMGGTSVVDQTMAALLAPGSVAAIGYANKITYSVLSVGAVALSTAMLPYFSRMVAANDWAGCRHTIKRYSVLVVSTTVPFTLLLILFSRPLVQLLFQRGAFTAADTALVSSVQTCYAIQIPFYVLSMIFVRFISAIHRNDVLLYASAINLGMDVVLNLVFMRIWNVAGIALATSIMYVVSFLMVSLWTVRFLAQERYQLPAVQPEGSQ